MQTVAIAGVGLIGGSFALALRAAGFTGRILGVSSPSTIAEAVRLGVIDEGVPLEDATKAADLLYLAQPISQILATIDRIAEIGPKNGGLITDAGSTKEAIVARAKAKLPAGQFIGGHPMAGKESRGVSAAEGDLFQNRPYVLTPVSNGDMDAPRIRELLGWIGRIEAKPVIMDAAEHDVTVSFTSHLPQLLSTALGCTLADAFPSGERVAVSGPGLSDTTRLALSDYEIWADIISTNQNNIAKTLGLYIDKLSEIRQNLTDPSMYERFRIGSDTAKRFRR